MARATIGSLFILLILILSGCQTVNVDTREFLEAPLYGMVYDSEGNAVMGAVIMLDSKDRATTGIDGRFGYSSVSKGSHIISIEKKGMESVKVDFDFIDRKLVFYARLYSMKGLISLAEDAISTREWGAASKALERALAVSPYSPVALYLEAILLKKTGKTKDAVAILEGLVALDKGYRAAWMLLADCYESDLGDLSNAARCLMEALSLRADEETRKRLEGLKDKVGS